MMVMGTANSLPRRLAAWLMLFAVLVRVAIPTGWMPNLQGLSSGALIVICSAQGLHSLELDASGKAMPAGGGEKRAGVAHQDCAFSGLANLSLPVPSVLPGIARTVHQLHFATIRVRPNFIRLEGAGDARGPPADLRA